MPGSGEIATEYVPFWKTWDTLVVVVIGWFRVAVCDPITGTLLTRQDSGTLTENVAAPAASTPTVPAAARKAVQLSASVETIAMNFLPMSPPTTVP